MALPNFDLDPSTSPWSTPEQQSFSTQPNQPDQGLEPTIESALEKERVIKDILTLRDGLRGLLLRITQVEGESEKLSRDNEILAVYIDNLTRNSVVAAGNKR